MSHSCRSLKQCLALTHSRVLIRILETLPLTQQFPDLRCSGCFVILSVDFSRECTGAAGPIPCPAFSHWLSSTNLWTFVFDLSTIFFTPSPVTISKWQGLVRELWGPLDCFRFFQKFDKLYSGAFSSLLSTHLWAKISRSFCLYSK